MNRKIFVSYADSRFRDAQQYGLKMALSKGKFDEVFSYTEKDVCKFYNVSHKEIKKRNPDRFQKYGLWRPFVLQDALKRIEENDILFYLDSGAFFIKPVDLLLKEFIKTDEYIMCFDIPTLERQWTKRDVFAHLNADVSYITDSAQRISGLIGIRKCEKSVDFVNRFVTVAVDNPELFTDSPSVRENYPEYIENRHNQSVFSVLTKKCNIKAFGDPTEMGDMPELYKKDKIFCYTITEDYPVSYRKVIISHRYPKITAYRRLKLFCRCIFPTRVYFAISFRLAGIRDFLGMNGDMR